MSEQRPISERLSLIDDPKALLEGLFAHAPVAFQVYRADGQCLLVNEAFRDLFGAEPPPDYNVLRDEIAAKSGVLDLIHRAFAGETVTLPTIWYDPRELSQVKVEQGRRVAVATRIFPLFDKNGRVAFVALAFRDETEEILAREAADAERRRLADALQEAREARARLARSEALLAAAQRITHLGSWELDLAHLDDVNRNSLRWSDEVFRIFGYEPDAIEVTNDNFFAAVHPDDRDAVSSAVRHALETGEPYSIEHRIILPDGRVRIVHEQSEIQYGEARRPLRMVGTVRDVTREREAAEALELSEERYRSLIDHAPEAIAVVDLEADRLVDANPAAELLFGRSRDELLATPPADLSPPLQPDGSRSADRRAERDERVLAGSLQVHEWSIQRADGQSVPCEVRIVRMPSPNRQLLRVSIVDISARKRLEELRARSAELESQNARIQEANRLKSEFLANMSHELRTPLNAIIGFAELLYDGQVGPESPLHREFLGDILNSGRHLAQLINDVLDLAKVEAGKLELRPERVELANLVGEVTAILRTLAAERRVSVSSDVDPELRDIEIDPGRFKQILYNYLSNALKFTLEGGRVAVRVKPHGPEMFKLEVEDTGIGIAPADLGRLFVEFQQLDTGPAKREAGTGLGLALTKRLAEAQGGAVGVESTLGKGSLFFAILPRRAGAASHQPERRAAAPRLGRRHILVVEDDPRDRELLGAILTEAGYSVAEATSGEDALQACRDQRFDAVTLDLLLPDMNGLELLSAIREGKRNWDVPVIVVTVVSDARVAGFAVHDVIHKPLEATQLLGSLRRAGLNPERAGGVLVVDDDPGALRLMETTLAKLGYEAICRQDARSGLEAARELSPVAVVLDLLMPDMDGFEFLARLRGDPRHAHIPVLVWTMHELTMLEEEQLRRSAQGVMSKVPNGARPLADMLQAFFAAPNGAS